MNNSKPESIPKTSYQVTSLAKALSVLDLLIDQDRGLSVTEISHKLGLAKGTVHRILNTLKVRSYVQQHNDTRLYSLGLRTLEIGALARKDRFLRSVMAPFLRDLSVMCYETVNAAVLEYNEIHYIFRLESEEMLRISAPLGVRFPAHCTATGKVMLSYHADDDIRRIYARRGALKRLTEHSIDSVDALIEEIEQIRISKVAIDDEETISGVYCVAAPLVNAKGECVAAISISAPKNRVPKQKGVDFISMALKTAGQISESLCQLEPERLASTK
jgi:IclR family transcriptional regulator, KDG regulon repressor